MILVLRLERSIHQLPLGGTSHAEDVHHAVVPITCKQLGHILVTTMNTRFEVPTADAFQQTKGI